MSIDTRLGILPAGAGGAADTWLDIQGVGSLKEGAARQSPETLKAVAQQFESIFLGMMLNSMRDAKLAESPYDSDETRFYQDMFDKQIALQLSKGKGLGIAAMLVRQLGDARPEGATAAAGAGGVPLAFTAGAAPSLPIPLQAPRAPGDGGTQTEGPPAPFASTAGEFVARVLPQAQAAAAELGVDPLALVAQAALETGWGRNVPVGADGSGYNLFGIKATGGWSGKRLARDTLEFAAGAPQVRREAFRAYDSVEAAFGDLVGLLRSSPRYADVVGSKADAGQYGAALQAAGYATDPAYGAKIDAIARSDLMRDALRSLKNRDAQPIP